MILTPLISRAGVAPSCEARPERGQDRERAEARIRENDDTQKKTREERSRARNALET